MNAAILPVIAVLCGPPFECDVIIDVPGLVAFDRFYQDRHFESCVLLAADRWYCVGIENEAS